MTKRRKRSAKKAPIKFAVLPAKNNTKTIQFSDREKPVDKVREVIESLPISTFNGLIYGDKVPGENRSKPPLFVIAIIGLKKKGREQFYSKVLKNKVFTSGNAKQHLLDTIYNLENDSNAANELLSANEYYEDDNEHALFDDETKEYLKGVDIDSIFSVSLKVVYIPEEKPMY